VKINSAALNRIIGSEINGNRIAELFVWMSQAPALPGATLALSLSWQEPGDVISEGEMVPSLTFTLRPSVNMDSSNAAIPGPTVADHPNPTPE